jgi:hypothetical protein
MEKSLVQRMQRGFKGPDSRIALQIQIEIGKKRSTAAMQIFMDFFRNSILEMTP